MSKTLTAEAFKGRRHTSGAIAVIAALAFSLAAVHPGAAATRHGKAAPVRTQTYYQSTSEGDPPAGMTAGQVGHRINPVLPGNGFGPPDPASCGGFNC